MELMGKYFSITQQNAELLLRPVALGVLGIVTVVLTGFQGARIIFQDVSGVISSCYSMTDMLALEMCHSLHSYLTFLNTNLDYFSL